MDEPITAHAIKNADVADTRSLLASAAFSPFFVTWFVMFFCIVGIGYWFYQQQMTYNRELAFERVRDIGDLKAQQLYRWLRERRYDATMLYEDHLALGLSNFLANPEENRLRQETRAWMKSLTRYYSYSDILLTNDQGHILLSIPANHQSIDKSTPVWSFIEQAINTQNVVLSDFYINQQGKPQLDYIVPIVTNNNDAAPSKLLAVLVLRIDPNDFVFPLLDEWPTQNQSVETLLIRRAGEFIVYLNRGLHGAADEALLQKISLDSIDLIAASSLQQKGGELTGRDHRGVKVIAAVRPVEESDWYLLAKIDQAEVDGPLRRIARQTLAIVVLAILVSTLGLWLVWGFQSERLLRRQKVMLERQVKTGSVALASTHQALQVALGERQFFVDEIVYQATHDMLTGLFNRQEFERRLGHLLGTVSNDGSAHAICYLDLDQFKIVNESCGHEAGDEMLRQLAGLFQTQVRQHDTLARLGGDEFGVLLGGCTPEQGQRLANALRQTVETFSFIWKNKRFRIGVSIGLVAIDKNSGNVAAVLRAADSACYVAKETGRNRIHVYHEQDENLLKRDSELQWVTRIPQALDENRFELYAQLISPAQENSDNRVHYELLLRLRDKNGQIVSPGVFLPVAERYQLAGRLDRWVVAHALQWLARHPDVSKTVALWGINLSGQSLSEESFLEFVLQQLDETAIFADQICFEITETAAIANLTGAVRFINSLKQRGCRFALDDFGSGLSSFAYLKNLPVDFVKIDGVFVKDIIDNPLDFAMVRSINEIGQLMDKKTIAEFVENETILDKLRSLGVDYVQGYGIGRPQPLRDLISKEILHVYQKDVEKG
jgi:diguanylate cyclase (GGDEF)-like protein